MFNNSAKLHFTGTERDGFDIFFYQLLIKISILQVNVFDQNINCFWSKYQIWKLSLRKILNMARKERSNLIKISKLRKKSNLIKTSKLKTMSTLLISSTSPTSSGIGISFFSGPKWNFGKPKRNRLGPDFVTVVIWTQSLATSAAFQF